ncbi:histone-like nucleoid-structuring protein Lsr2 [Nocardioides insulae]|uniref:histone-like nucleoid-structuring protein Lsr2 n=1 Tax=Nocardioides insulae TaxID=394734 RepID=UPI000415D148|nr:Lsr2 family protein [Nocardioides insulae]
MAQKVHIVLEDDLDGSEATETITFALDGASYEIDLNDENAAKLRDAFAVYAGHARKITAGGRRAGRRGAAPAGGPSPKDIRAWAREAGYTVPDRGRIPAEVRSAYDAAH